MQYSNDTNHVLISMYYGSSIEKNYFDTVTLHRLFNDKYIWYTAPHSNILCLTDAGKAYVESLLASKADKKIEKFRFWIPVIISLIALIKSFMPEITAIFRAIMELLSQSPMQ